MLIGASAGGIEALSTLVATFSPDFPAPIVIAQHLDPNRPSHLGEILSRHGPLPVRSVDEHDQLTPGTIYVVPANRHVEITDHVVRVYDDPSRPKPSVDLLLVSAAPIYGERLIAVILTGSGSDGAVGARAVKEAGGTVIVQDPATAAYPSMPRSLAPTTVDVVAPLARIGQVLTDIISGFEPVESPAGVADLQHIVDRVRDRRGVDFSLYKPPTIARRLRRRMAAVSSPTLDHYLRYIDDHPEEEQRLISSFLIKVTEFFRDPALFDYLRAEILPRLIAEAQAADRELRIWSAGCATGEEAYSLAIMVNDLLAGIRGWVPVRIFATDLDDEAVTFARRGVYPGAALKNLPDDLIDRHFTSRDGAFEVNKPVRGSIIFGQHDLGQRPPFGHTDLILCRNVLIYFTAPLQERTLRLFAYSLRDGGCLALGTSESPRPLGELFASTDRRHRVYRRQGPRPPLPPTQLSPSSAASSRGEPFRFNPSARTNAFPLAQPASADASTGSAPSDDFIRALPIGVVVVDHDYDIQMINGAARELLGIHNLAVGQDFVHLAQHIPSTPLRAAIDAVARGDDPLPIDDIVTTESATGETRFLTLSCHRGRLQDNGSVENVVVLIQNVTSVVLARQGSEQSSATQEDELARLRSELTRVDTERESLARTSERLADANRHLLTANRELTDAVDELRERADELRIANASAQVAAEEIETLNEEMQSTNEELETLNEETQSTNEELHAANDDLQARSAELEALAATLTVERARLATILLSMGDAVLVIDSNGNTVRTNPAYDELMGDADFVPQDAAGMPFLPDTSPQRRAANSEAFRLDFTTTAADGERRWFEATGRPLRGDTLSGGVLVIRDVSDRSLHLLQDQFLALAGHELRTPLAALQGYLQLSQRQAGPNGNSDRLSRYLAVSLDQVQRLGKLISDLVDVTRLQSGKLALILTPVDLVPLAARVVEAAQVLTDRQDIRFETREHSVMVDGDAGRLEQVMLNLVTNAIAYAPGSDRIDVRLERVGDNAEILVEDFGLGIAEADLTRIFSRFAQVERSDEAAVRGLGLGLFIAQEIAEGHGGQIDVRSVVDEGTTFTIRLPLLVREAVGVSDPGG